MTLPTNHTQLLNWLIEKHGLKSYLELGVQSAKNNFNKINVEDKWGVDPNPDDATKILNRIHLNTSDEYFDAMFDAKFDLVFIDGLHHADQVKKDFENSLRCLNDNGFIVIHDTCPENEVGTKVPRETRRWWGDVYKFVMTLDSYPGIEHATLEMDEGCTIVWKNASVEYVPCIFGDEGATWQKYLDWKDRYYNIVTPESFFK